MENQNPLAPRRFNTINRPPLGPLDSGVNANHVSYFHIGEEMNDAATRQRNNRKRLKKTNYATAAEVLAAEKRKAAIMADSISPLPTGQDLAREILLRLELFEKDRKSTRLNSSHVD